MDQILDFFSNLSSPQKLFWIVFCLLFFSAIEKILPLFEKQDHHGGSQHTKTNLFFLSTTILINVVFGVVTAGVFIWIENNQFGILHLIDMPIWLEVLIGIMLLDFIAQYVVHYLLHKVKFMWKFHMVHHSDTHINATTGTRHHPGDFIMRETFALFAVIIGGLPFATYMIYRILTIVFTYFIHANINIPLWFDKLVSLIFISPNMHKFHHHFERPWTDTNLGNIFSFWDRIFGTMAYDDPKKIKYGLDVLEDKYANDVMYQLKVPFDNTIKTDY